MYKHYALSDAVI